MVDATADCERTLILASASPRRRELLENLGFHLVLRPTDIPEVRAAGEYPVAYTRRLSREKADAVVDAATESATDAPWIVAADTVVVRAGAVLEKPADRAGAIEMLTALSGEWHEVVTSFTVRSSRRDGLVVTRTVRSDVRFRTLPAESIAAYVDTGEPMDKAGAYGIQRIGAFLVRELRGSYFAVMGLPLCEVVEALQEVGAVSTFPFP